jgi:hypothetical protein
MKSSRTQFDCNRCPAYCCTYPLIPVTKRDLKRLAKHFGIGLEKAEKRFSKKGSKKRERVLRHQEDHIFGTACRFLDTETRNCTIYKARPQICRDFPGTKRCGYYDFLTFERRQLDDPDHIAVTNNT